jgi:hypothetical protein
MSSDTAQYYQERAAAERLRAKTAKDSRAVKIHVALAEEYEKRAKELSS